MKWEHDNLLYSIARMLRKTPDSFFFFLVMCNWKADTYCCMIELNSASGDIVKM